VLDFNGLWKSFRKTVDNFVENSIPMPANPEKSSLSPNCPSSEQAIRFNEINDLAEMLQGPHVALQHGVTAKGNLGFCA
jgi:hypothetical protein